MADTIKRVFPDISFVDADTETLLNTMILAYERITKKRLYPADPARIFILVMADIIVQERVIINESAKQNVPRFARGVYLDSLAEIFRDTERLQPTPARTTLRFTISASQPSAVTIPQGTRVTVDGNITFETIENAIIPVHEDSAEVPAVCLTLGTSGNGFIPGQIAQIVDVFPFFESVSNITVSNGGSDMETDEAFYERLRTSLTAFSTAGSVGAYIYHAKTASARIVDVSVTSPLPGVVDIRVLLENGERPGQEMLDLVLKKISGGEDGVRPFTDFVQVSAPETKPFDIDVTYYIQSPRSDSAAVIQTAAETALNEYKRWQTERMGRDINPSRLNELLMSAGVKRTEIRSPAFAVVQANEVAALGSVNFIFGGIEDE